MWPVTLGLRLSRNHAVYTMAAHICSQSSLNQEETPPLPTLSRQSIPQNHLRQESRGHDDLNGKTIHEKGSICICLADSVCCTVKLTQDCKATLLQ